MTLATPGIAAQLEQQAEDIVFASMLDMRFLEQIQQPLVIPKPVPDYGENRSRSTIKGTFEVIEWGHRDTYASTILWAPALRLEVCADALHGWIEPILREVSTYVKRL